MTSKTRKPWPFLVQIEPGSAAIADQVKCIDWRGRRAQVKGRVRDDMLERVISLFCRIILPPDL
jgi:mRNA-degrading endonuclease toxin of MazEF toxin-antitoxin module